MRLNGTRSHLEQPFEVLPEVLPPHSFQSVVRYEVECVHSVLFHFEPPSRFTTRPSRIDSRTRDGAGNAHPLEVFSLAHFSQQLAGILEHDRSSVPHALIAEHVVSHRNLRGHWDRRRVQTTRLIASHDHIQAEKDDQYQRA